MVLKVEKQAEDKYVSEAFLCDTIVFKDFFFDSRFLAFFAILTFLLHLFLWILGWFCATFCN